MNRKRENERPLRLPQPGEGKRGEHGHLAYLLRQAAAAVRGRMERALDDLGVTAPQFVVLTLVGAYPGLSNADLARLSHLTPQTVNVIVGNLKQSGAVASRQHESHGRIQQIALTGSGEDLLARCRPRVRVVESRLTVSLTAAEERCIRQWLVRMATDSDDQVQLAT